MSALAPAERSRSGSATESAETQRLYERYSARIFGYCLNWLGTREEAEDATQTTFMNVQRGLRRGVVPEFEAAWLFKIAQNVCRTRHERSSHRLDTPRDLDAFQDTVAAREEPDPHLVPELVDALSRMPAIQRRALLHREWQGLSYREIAAELGVTQSAVETLLFRARRSLAANLEQPTRKGRTSRFGLGSFIPSLKSLLTGGGAVKVAVGALVVTATVAATGATENHSVGTSVPAISPTVSRAFDHTKPAPRAGATTVRPREGRGPSRTRPVQSGPPRPPEIPAATVRGEALAQSRSAATVAAPSPASAPAATFTVSLPAAQVPSPPLELPPPPSVQLSPPPVELPPPPSVQLPSLP